MARGRPYLELEHFDPDVIRGKNSAAAGLTSWVQNIIYYDIGTTVEPKRKASGSPGQEAASSKLKIVKDTVVKLQAKLAKLTKEFNAADKEKRDAIDIVDKGQKKLGLATRLINALSSEGVRWKANIEEMEASRELLTGDVLLASAFISYIGLFTKRIANDFWMIIGSHF